MSEASLIVAVDIGNSAVKFSCRPSQSTLDHSVSLREAAWAEKALQWVQQHGAIEASYWRIASVQHFAAESLIRHLQQPQREGRLRIISHRDVPMPIDVDAPERVGIDRILSAYAARELQGGPVVVVDAGSAITVDWVDETGHFCGGAILPGLKLQSHALASGTDALPEVFWQQNDPLPLPARNTGDAIRGGILAGAAAAIDALVDRYCSQLAPGTACPVIVSGGDGPTLAVHLRRQHELIPNLVCRGLLQLPK